MLWVSPVFLTFLLYGCAGGGGVRPVVYDPTQPRVYHDPYRDVDWDNDYRLKAQHHDHPTDPPETTDLAVQEVILAYDAAGYDVISIMHYSGVASLDYAWKEKRWPSEDWLSQPFLNNLQNVKFFIPNAEESGFGNLHVTSPFLSTYIAKWQPNYYIERQPWHYSTKQELIDLINSYGGMVFIAHPTEPYETYAALKNYAGIEIYSAYIRHRDRRAGSEFDANAILLSNWDSMLLANQSVLGIAVNDHFGPNDPRSDADVKDSGKIVVLSQASTPAGYRDALETGSFLAVMDIGLIKDRYPVVHSITLEEAKISIDPQVLLTIDSQVLLTIDTAEEVTWVANGNQVASGNSLRREQLPLDAVYVRAEVTNAEGSIVFTQAFTIRKAGDKDGDGDIDEEDDQVCTDVWSGSDIDRDHINACA